MTAAVRAAREGIHGFRGGPNSETLAEAITETPKPEEPVNLRDIAELSKGRIREGVVFRSSQFLRSAYLATSPVNALSQSQLC